MSQLAQPRDDVSAQLCITIQGNEQTYTHMLPDGESILIGSDMHCRIRIPDASVPDRQCLLQYMQGEVFVHDWSPEHPTMVNGAPSDASVPLPPGARVTFGSFVLDFGRSFGESAEHEPVATQETAPPPAEPASDLRAELAAATAPASVATPEVSEVSRAPEPEPEPEPSTSAVASVSQSPVGQSHAGGEIEDDPWNSFARPEPPPFVPPPVDVDASTIALLTAEIQSLQAELAEKNDRLAGQESTGSGIDEEETSELESRIGQLLEELEASDQRTAAVEEALRLSEETRHAELEEKRQLEQWVSDIEQRVAERESESQAECDVLRRKLAETQQQQEAAEGQVSSLIDQSTDEVLQDMVQVLRRENEQLRDRSEGASEQIAALQRDVETYRQQATDSAIEDRVNEAIRVERLQLAQERAAISRQQLELTSQSKELSEQLDRKGHVNQADDRFRVFREQLRELHQQEKQEYVPPTITQRLTKLWQKLDGPTDTD